MDKLDFIDWAIKNGYGSTVVPMAVITVILEYEKYLNSGKLLSDMPTLENFRERRVKLGHSMQSVSSWTGVSKATISRIERGIDSYYSNVKSLHDFYTTKGA